MKKIGMWQKIRLLMQYQKNMRYAKNNIINIPKMADIKLKISGWGNVIDIPDCQGKMKIHIHGNNNTIKFGTNANFTGKIFLGCGGYHCNNSRFIIGENFECGGLDVQMMESDTSITIGDNCMFSWDVTIWCTDTHSVIDENDGHLLNLGKSVEIGNHVWVARNVFIAKNTKISDNSIVGWCSNVTRCFNETNVIIAGNPAQIVKRGINWSSVSPEKYLESYTNSNNLKVASD